MKFSRTIINVVILITFVVFNASVSSGQSSGIILIDGFERANPYDFYIIRQGDASIMALSSSRLVHDGDYSMEMTYTISSEKSIGSWVSASWEGKHSLSWTNVEAVKIWVKGDGTSNIFRFNITDADGEVWMYEDEYALRSTKWKLINMPIEDFAISNLSASKNQMLDLHKIPSFEISVLSEESGDKNGTIYVDQLYIIGTGVQKDAAAPKNVVEKLSEAVPKSGNIDLSGVIHTEYFRCPELSQQLFHWAKLFASAKIDNFSARVEFGTENFGSEGQNFGDAASYQRNDNNTAFEELYHNAYSFEAQNPAVNSPNIQVMINNINPAFNIVTVGNLYFEYSRYTFMMPQVWKWRGMDKPVGWGWKGISAEGDVEKLNYHAFYIKQPYDSYVLGTRWIGFWTNWKMSAYYVNTYESAKDNVSVTSGGTTSSTQNIQVKPILTDTVCSVELIRWFFNRDLQLEFIAGWNDFKREGKADYTDRYQPVWNEKIEPVEEYQDTLYIARIETNDMLMEDLKLAYEYRDVGKEYKPYFRYKPFEFDDTDVDQTAHNIKLTQWIGNFAISAQHDEIQRKFNSSESRQKTNTTIAYHGFRGMEISHWYERKKEVYVSSSTRSSFDRNRAEDVNSHEIYVRTELSPGTILIFKFRQENILWLNDGSTFANNSFYTKLEYTLGSNAKLFGEYKTMRYPEAAWEPQGYPFDENYTKVTFELTF